MNIIIDSYCDSCGDVLNASVIFDNRKDTIKIMNDPCENCIDDATEKGKEEGFDEGHSVGYDKGREEAEAEEKTNG